MSATLTTSPVQATSRATTRNRRWYTLAALCLSLLVIVIE